MEGFYRSLSLQKEAQQKRGCADGQRRRTSSEQQRKGRMSFLPSSSQAKPASGPLHIV